jgi:hypothetical protein
LLAETVTRGGRSESVSRGGTSNPLPEGMSRNMSQRWQVIAGLADHQFEAFLA